MYIMRLCILVLDDKRQYKYVDVRFHWCGLIDYLVSNSYSFEERFRKARSTLIMQQAKVYARSQKLMTISTCIQYISICCWVAYKSIYENDRKTQRSVMLKIMILLIYTYNQMQSKTLQYKYMHVNRPISPASKRLSPPHPPPPPTISKGSPLSNHQISNAIQMNDEVVLISQQGQATSCYEVIILFVQYFTTLALRKKKKIPTYPYIRVRVQKFVYEYNYAILARPCAFTRQALAAHRSLVIAHCNNVQMYVRYLYL